MTFDEFKQTVASTLQAEKAVMFSIKEKLTSEYSLNNQVDMYLIVLEEVLSTVAKWDNEDDEATRDRINPLMDALDNTLTDIEEVIYNNGESKCLLN